MTIAPGPDGAPRQKGGVAPGDVADPPDDATFASTAVTVGDLGSPVPTERPSPPRISLADIDAFLVATRQKDERTVEPQLPR
ncbi:hypothetical protein GCM10010488_19350 [Oerskovia jenensis]